MIALWWKLVGPRKAEEAACFEAGGKPLSERLKDSTFPRPKEAFGLHQKRHRIGYKRTISDSNERLPDPVQRAQSTESVMVEIEAL